MTIPGGEAGVEVQNHDVVVGGQRPGIEVDRELVGAAAHPQRHKKLTPPGVWFEFGAQLTSVGTIHLSMGVDGQESTTATLCEVHFYF